MALPARNIVARPQDQLYTAQDFELMPQFNEGYELVDGRLLLKDMPNPEHSLIARIVTRAYDRFDPNEQSGRMLQEISVKLNVKNTPAPDVAFWKADRKPSRSQTAADPPDLAIEIWSPHDLDTTKRQQAARDKVRRYLEAGVPLVWAINPANQTVEVYRLGQPQPAQVLSINDALDGENLIPGFRLELKLLFETD